MSILPHSCCCLDAKTWADHIAASIEGFFWPKFFFDFLTKCFDGAVKPIPILQTINLLLGIITLAYEWPLKYLAGTAIHKSIEVRIFWLPLVSLSCVLMYQATDPALYYLIALAAYFWAYTEGEVSRLLSIEATVPLLTLIQVICAVPWTLPKRTDRKQRPEKV